MAKYKVQVTEIEEIYGTDRKLITDLEGLEILDCIHRYTFQVEAESKEDAITKIKRKYNIQHRFTREVQYDTIKV